MVPGVSLKMIQDDRIGQSYMHCSMMLWHLLTSYLHLLFWLKALFLFFCMATFARCTNQDSNCICAGANLRHKRWYDTNMIWYVCNGRCRSLMCTSNVAGNTQRLVSIASDAKWINFLSQVCYAMYGSRCFSQDDPRWSDRTILYALWYDAMALAYKFLCSLFFFA